MVKINETSSIELRIDEFIKKKSFKLFLTNENDNLIALFDKSGFWFDKQTKSEYKKIMSLPHIYIAFSSMKDGYIYIGMSNQNRGRWQRGHAYHLGTLAHSLLGTTNSFDQDHSSWIKRWMKLDTMNINDKIHCIKLKEDIFISFVPLNFYENDIKFNAKNLTDRQVNQEIEKRLIHFYKKKGLNLLNIIHNK